MTGKECAVACETLANFFGNQRDLTCDRFLIQRPLDASDISISVDAGYFEPDWDKPRRPDQIYPGGVACTFLTARLPLHEQRPQAKTAFLALGSVAALLEVDIFEASGRMLDSTLPISQLKLCCVADLEGTDTIATFLDSQEHFRDRDYIPHIVTEYRNHENKPITVELNFYPAI